MRILTASLLMVGTFVIESFCFDLKCVNVESSEELYDDCDVYDLVITSSDDTITSVNGNTHPTMYNNLLIKNQTVHFVPQNIAYFFPRLVQLEISYSHLERIEQGDIRELTQLEQINLEGNKLEILEKNLFAYNTVLQTINVRKNQLRFINKDIFYHLNSLIAVYLEGNICTTSIYEHYFKNANSYRRELVSQLNSYCQSWESVLIIYKTKFDKKINDLQLENEKLTHRLKTCDGNLDAALMNFHQQKLVNSNAEFTVKPNEFIKIMCEYNEEHVCNAVDFKVSFANSSIESGYFKEIETLQIYQQQTLFLPQNLDEHFPMMNELTVTESGLYEIDYNVLKGLSLLVTLNLTNNKLPEIPIDTFTDLEELQQLDLSFNKIRALHDDVFTSLKNLRKLYLNNNYLTSIKIKVFENLDNLTGLFLHDNLLKFISATLLAPLTNLEFVDFSDNVCIDMSYPTSSLIDVEATIIDNCISPVELYCKSVETVETENDEKFENTCQVDDLFIEYPKTKISKVNGTDEPIDNINVFYADKQSINFFPFQLAQKFPNLERIEIQQSKLTALHKMDFDGFSKLLQIIMNNNNLSMISEGTFDSVPQLEVLDLSSNSILSLPTKIFIKLNRLRTLLLSNNLIVKFTADFLARKNMIDIFCADNNQLEIIETKTLRFLRKAKTIDFTGNVCIDMKFDKTENSTRALVELSGEIDLNCSADD